MSNRLKELQARLAAAATVPNIQRAVYFKTGPGSYAEHDQFLGIKNPVLHELAKEFCNLSLAELEQLIQSPFNEGRLLALFIATAQYKKAKAAGREEIYQWYIRNLSQVNNWNLVDASAHLIMGPHVAVHGTAVLFALVKSESLWDRRIAMVATWHFIRLKDTQLTFTIAELLIDDHHDLIHKAVGWMLREAGKWNEAGLLAFLDTHAAVMPRTMLRYALEKLAPDVRARYMAAKASKKA
ncbi:MAG: hypothetical protein QG632_905 [Candidatus Dependentiae bacterium]|nr:hypothetical protein [Candidatus Dependentiae bacterium]